ncbi:uncharacterized protein [Drosophila virilis]|uniref:Single domain-containing protein n=1 Tax=Drosophila virilis TaxID=7244 RepID=B4M769_DROVI|nr:uncharacterized protein LOC6633269 [Drosophila virilis]EDW62636.1 uncharacterized protein Dvir_GJ16509 [Drosophila virilis]
MRNNSTWLGATIGLLLLLLMMMLMMLDSYEAVSEPVCTYRNAEDETVFLKYLPLLKKGQDYVDFGKEGKCLKRAICTDTFKTIVEECADQKVTCLNKQRYTGVFPACCVKCA